MSRSRAWCFTINNPASTKEELITTWGCEYCIMADEIGESGTPHIQGYIEFDNAKTLTTLKKKYSATAHWEVRKGSAKEASTYCKKDGKFIESGDISNQGARTDLNEIADEIKQGVLQQDIATNHFTQWCQYGKRFEDFRNLIETKRNWITDVIILWGESGSGKSFYASKFNAKPVLFKNGFMINYEGEDTVVFEEFDLADFGRNMFLQITDRYPMMVNVKGGSRNWKPKTIYLTSNFDPTGLLQDPAIARRISGIFEFTQK